MKRMIKEQKTRYNSEEEFIWMFRRYEAWSKGFGNLGRNDFCACGSGKKYKKCCMKNTESDFSKFKAYAIKTEQDARAFYGKHHKVFRAPRSGQYQQGKVVDFLDF